MSLYIVLYFSSVSVNLCMFFFFEKGGRGVFYHLSVCIDFSLEGYKFISVRHYYVLPSLTLNKDSTAAAATDKY